MKAWRYLVTAVFFDVTGSLALRASIDDRIWVALVVISYCCAFYFFASTLGEGAPVGIAYGLWAAGAIPMTAFLASFIFGDPLTWMMALGIGLLLIGVILIQVPNRSLQTPIDSTKSMK